MDDYKFELTTPTVIRPPATKEKDIIGSDGITFEVNFFNLENNITRSLLNLVN